MGLREKFYLRVLFIIVLSNNRVCIFNVFGFVVVFTLGFINTLLLHIRFQLIC